MAQSHYYKCSVITLCVATITCLISVAFMGIAFSTDNWLHISVDRGRLLSSDRILSRTNINEDTLKNDPKYFDRVQGIFRTCFPYSDRPNWTTSNAKIINDHRRKLLDAQVFLYLNPIDEWCMNVNYYLSEFFSDGLFAPKGWSRDAQVWVHFARMTITSFCL